jgi:hypothetical protein
MGLDFVDRSLRSFGIVLLVFLPFGFYYLGAFNALAVLSGGVWGIVNLILISKLIRLVIRPGGAANAKGVAFVLVLFAGLFVAGYFLLSVEQFEPWLLLIGFTGLFLIMFLKALGRWITGADDQPTGQENAQKVV